MAQKGQYPELVVGQDDVATGEELEVYPIQPIAKLKLDYSVGSYLRDGGKTAGLEDLAQFLYEDGGRGGGGAFKVCQMTSKAGVYEELFLVVGLGELEEKDLGGQVVDVVQAQRDETRRELMSDDL